MSTIVSYGLIVGQNKGSRLLMIRKANTYEFCEFLLGKYERHDHVQLRKMFSLMTFDEKRDILTGDFALMWKRVYSSVGTKQFISKQSQFMLNWFGEKDRARLISLIEGSLCADPLWEFPKGKKNMDEQETTAALREFFEETGIPPSSIEILKVPPLIDSYRDKREYRTVLYFAILTQDIDLKFTFRRAKQCPEASAIRMVSKQDLHVLNLPQGVKNRILRAFEIAYTKFDSYRSTLNWRH